MTTLYSVRSTSHGYLIAKFDDAFDVTATYELEGPHCSCPAWPRKQHCKHLDMLTKFLARDKIDTEWFWEPDAQAWHSPLDEVGPRVVADIELAVMPAPEPKAQGKFVRRV